MGREILFRGRRLDGDGWAYGDLMHWGKSTRIYKEGAIHEVDPKTVGQYIGIKDKNDKKVFENDNIRTSYFSLSKVIKKFTTPVRYDRGGYIIRHGSQFINIRDWVPEIEIIGNIHDNKQELKVAKD